MLVMKTNNYDPVAPFYDSLSRLIFGRSQVNAQIEQLKHIPAGARILIVGGGTGWVLEEIARVHASGLAITYVEISAKMLSRAKTKESGNNLVHFVHAGIEQFTPPGKFDLIHTAFLFDNFSASRVNLVFDHLDDLLQEGGLWLFCDFKLKQQDRYGWKHIMLKMMYLFFRTIAGVEAKKLHEVEALFNLKNYQIISRKAHYRGFIESIIFRKSRNFHTFI
jgi:ubiquinone/menaquinone biosynthesis C-methylase UbiE